MIFLSGCTASYELEIDDNMITEKLTFSEDTNYISSYTSPEKYLNSELQKIYENKKYTSYNISTNIDENITGIGEKKYLTFDKFKKNSILIGSVFNDAIIKTHLNETSILFKINKDITYFDENELYESFLDAIDIKIKIPYVIIDGNYDTYDGEYYIWEFSRKEDLRDIEISYKTDIIQKEKIGLIFRVILTIIVLSLIYVFWIMIKSRYEKKY